MPKKNHASKKQTTINSGNISGVSGIVNIAGGNITTHHSTNGFNAVEIKLLFEPLYSAIETNTKTSSADKDDLKAEAKEIQFMVVEAAKNNEKVDEGFLLRHFRNIARLAPDVLDIVVATLGSPLAGLGVAVRKIAEKAKEETKH